MQDRELYEQILGLSSPWKVTKVELKAEASEVHVLWSILEARSSAVLTASLNWPAMTMRGTQVASFRYLSVQDDSACASA